MSRNPAAEQAPTLSGVGALPAAVTDLLTVVLEALDLPHPAAAAGGEVHDRLLNDRVVHARIALRSVLDDNGPGLGPAWEAEYLRARLAEHPVTGYVTVDEADAGIAVGKTWSEAVALPAGEGQ